MPSRQNMDGMKRQILTLLPPFKHNHNHRGLMCSFECSSHSQQL